MNTTIVATATPPGRGGVGVVRVSGAITKQIIPKICGGDLKPRYAHFRQFKNLKGTVIDEGLALFFPGPHSFTGEDVLEIQGHGSPVVMDLLIQALIEMGAEMARPGEFSERAFLNDKIDLTQAEAIADLIDASSHQAAASALNSLKGAFSECVRELVASVIAIRMYVEAAIDFPEEEIDFLTEGNVASRVEAVLDQLYLVESQAHQGKILAEGMTVVIIGKPNAGKSSLLNQLAGEESAIVTNIAGTTRDILKQHIQLNGMPLHIIDTAGLRQTDNIVEQEGVKRALTAAKEADRLLILLDIQDDQAESELRADFSSLFELGIPVTTVYNKIDLLDSIPDQSAGEVLISAKTGSGIDALKAHLIEAMGYQQSTEGLFSARRRHLDALDKAKQHIQIGLEKVRKYRAGELLAEELRIAQDHLNEITGEFRADDLLGEIFSAFCIGK